MALTDYTRSEILDNIESELGDLVPATLTTVSQDVRVRDFAELRKVIGREDLPAVFVIEPPGEVQTDKRSSAAEGITVPHNRYITDLFVSLIGLAAVAENEIPHKDVVVPLYDAIIEKVLEDPQRGGNAIFTFIDSDAHTAHTMGDRVAFVITMICPFEWGS